MNNNIVDKNKGIELNLHELIISIAINHRKLQLLLRIFTEEVMEKHVSSKDKSYETLPFTIVLSFSIGVFEQQKPVNQCHLTINGVSATALT